MTRSKLTLFSALSTRIFIFACILAPLFSSVFYQVLYQTLSQNFIASKSNHLFGYAQLLEIQNLTSFDELGSKLLLENLSFNEDVIDVHLTLPDQNKVIVGEHSTGLSLNLPKDTDILGNDDQYFVQTISLILNGEYAELTGVFREESIGLQLRKLTAIGIGFILVFTIFLLLFNFRQFQRVSKIATELRVNAEKIAKDEQGGDLYIESDIYEFQGLSLSLDKMHSKLEKQKEELSRQVFTDPLTKIPNRLFFEQLLKRYKKSLVKNQQTFAVALMDINNFKQVNDSYGHPMGDRLLVLTSRLLTRVVKVVNGRVARIGGDEFALIFLADSADMINKVAQEITTRISRMVYLSDRRLELTISIGGVFVDSGNISEDEIVKRSDVALYAAKNDVTKGLRVFDDQLFLAENRYDAILEALKSQFYMKPGSGFDLRFQPKFDLNNMTVIGFEALSYWNHPTLGYLRPDHFIPLAEQQGLMTRLTEHIINTCIDAISGWKKAFGCEIPIAINISPHDLKDPYFVSRLMSSFKGKDIRPESIEFEVTENAFIENYKQVKCALAELQSKGFSIAIDDFGVGYSNLANLNNLPAKTIKIDKMFIQGCEPGNDRYYIVRAVVDLAKQLKMQCVAEGIDSPAIRELLKEMGCKFGQGEWLEGYFTENTAPDFWLKKNHSNGELASLKSNIKEESS